LTITNVRVNVCEGVGLLEELGVIKEQQIVLSEAGSQQGYEPPRLSVIGTFEELTKVKGPTSNDGPGGGHKSV
jgi:hypothetical protein